jgi:hypothetical protein
MAVKEWVRASDAVEAWHRASDAKKAGSKHASDAKQKSKPQREPELTAEPEPVNPRQGETWQDMLRQRYVLALLALLERADSVYRSSRDPGAARAW